MLNTRTWPIYSSLPLVRPLSLSLFTLANFRYKETVRYFMRFVLGKNLTIYKNPDYTFICKFVMHISMYANFVLFKHFLTYKLFAAVGFSLTLFWHAFGCLVSVCSTICRARLLFELIPSFPVAFGCWPLQCVRTHTAHSNHKNEKLSLFYVSLYIRCATGRRQWRQYTFILNWKSSYLNHVLRFSSSRLCTCCICKALNAISFCTILLETKVVRDGTGKAEKIHEVEFQFCFFFSLNLSNAVDVIREDHHLMKLKSVRKMLFPVS